MRVGVRSIRLAPAGRSYTSRERVRDEAFTRCRLPPEAFFTGCWARQTLAEWGWEHGVATLPDISGRVWGSELARFS